MKMMKMAMITQKTHCDNDEQHQNNNNAEPD